MSAENIPSFMIIGRATFCANFDLLLLMTGYRYVSCVASTNQALLNHKFVLNVSSFYFTINTILNNYNTLMKLLIKHNDKPDWRPDK